MQQADTTSAFLPYLELKDSGGRKCDFPSRGRRGAGGNQYPMENTLWEDASAETLSLQLCVCVRTEGAAGQV